jgi:DNA-binding NarL/FixJ family response regulator
MERFRILVVDDFKPFRRLVCSILEQTTQFQVVGQASDGLEAVRKVEELQPDLVLLDIGMPRLNGLEAATRISVLGPATKIVFLSQNEDPNVVQTALKAGGSGYVLKSDVTDLPGALIAVLRGDIFISLKLRS